MSQIVSIQVEGTAEQVSDAIRGLRAHLAEPRVFAVWSPVRWQEGEHEQVRETFHVEIKNASDQATAIDRVRKAVEAVDPNRKVIKGGGIDWQPVE